MRDAKLDTEVNTRKQLGVVRVVLIASLTAVC